MVKKKILLIIFVTLMWVSSVAFAFVVGGSNLSPLGYPQFDEYISYNPTREEVSRYVEAAKEYVENCNYDVQRVYEARNEAVDKANTAINNYNMNNQ